MKKKKKCKKPRGRREFPTQTPISSRLCEAFHPIFCFATPTPDVSWLWAYVKTGLRESRCILLESLRMGLESKDLFWTDLLTSLDGATWKCGMIWSVSNRKL